MRFACRSGDYVGGDDGKIWGRTREGRTREGWMRGEG